MKAKDYDVNLKKKKKKRKLKSTKLRFDAVLVN